MNILTGAQGTLSGSPGANINGTIGVGTNYTGTQQTTFTNQLGQADASATLAAIFVLNALNSATSVIISSSNTAGAGWGVGLNSSNQLIMIGWAGTNTSSTTIGALVASVPYFVAVTSGGTGTATRFILMRLDTGRLLTENAAAAVATGNTGTTTYVIGNAVATRPINGKVAAAMFAPSVTPTASLVAWAYDPWSFWYGS